MVDDGKSQLTDVFVDLKMYLKVLREYFGMKKSKEEWLGREREVIPAKLSSCDSKYGRMRSCCYDIVEATMG
jgi:hypothetical protein